MRARFSVLLALFLACAPIASAQLAVTQQVSHYNLDGTWRVFNGAFGTLTLTQNANGTVRGTFASTALLLTANASACRGDHRDDARGVAFVVLCQQTGKPPVLISGATLPRTFTQAAAPAPQMRGFIYLVQPSHTLSTTPIGGGIAFEATR